MPSPRHLKFHELFKNLGQSCPSLLSDPKQNGCTIKETAELLKMHRSALYKCSDQG
ncbi:hypothetical protein [Polaromonas sp. CG9_12]|nr:hypothetical protein [Polaromonas sp. CG9_12]